MKLRTLCWPHGLSRAVVERAANMLERDEECYCCIAIDRVVKDHRSEQRYIFENTLRYEGISLDGSGFNPWMTEDSPKPPLPDHLIDWGYVYTEFDVYRPFRFAMHHRVAFLRKLLELPG